MSITREDLDALREGWDFEAKKAAGRDGRGEVPLSFWETYSAMANSYGGRIVLGVKERRDHSFVVHGIADPEKVERDLWTTLDNPSKVSVNLMGRDHVEQEVLDGRTIIVIRVPRASRQQRPVYINNDIWSGTFVRMHEGDHSVGREQVRRMIADAEYDTRDDRLLLRFGMDELEAQFGQDFTDLDPNDQIVLAAARAEGRVDHPRLRELVDLHSRDLTVLLQRFLRNGMLERIGHGKGCTYRVPAAERPMDGGGDSEQKRSRSVQNGDGSVHSGPGSEQNGGQSEHESTEDPGEIGPRQDPPWWDEPEVRQVRGTRRTSPQTVTAAILAACRGGYATLPELGRGLNRSPETLRVHYVSSLVREGRLEMLYPGAPNDPRQAYRTPDRARGGGGP
jgi:Schlafen, AlbA_2